MWRGGPGDDREGLGEGWASQVTPVVRNLLASARDTGSIPASGRSPGVGNGNRLQYSFLRNPMDRGAWWAVLHEVTKSQTRLSTHAHRVRVRVRAAVHPGRPKWPGAAGSVSTAWPEELLLVLFLGCLSACLTRKKSSSRVPSGPQGASAPPSPSGPPAGHTGSGEAGPQCPRPGEEVGDAFLPSEQRTQTLPTRWLAEQGHQERRKERWQTVSLGLYLKTWGHTLDTRKHHVML